MSAPVLAKALRDHRRGVAGWSVGLLCLLLLEGALWPSVRDMTGMDELLAGYPEPLQELFDLEAMSTGVGFLNAELFTLVLPALFIVFGISRGAQSVAGEEERGTLELLVVTPMSNTRLLIEKAAGLVAAVLALGAALFIATMLSSALFDLRVPVASGLAGAAALSGLGVEFGCVALAAGAATGRRGVAVVVSAVAAVAAYVLYVAGLLVADVGDWSGWSPFHQALSGGPLGRELPGSSAWLLLGAVAVVAASAPVFARRDVRHV